jgi:hypothetical protein
MKMYALYSVDDIPNLEFNHRKYCDTHNIEYNKINVANSLSDKYCHILSCLQNNIGETLIFIDDLSYFNRFDFFPSLNEDVLIQKNKNTVIDNFFIVKSNISTIKIFSDALKSINHKGFKEKYWKQVSWLYNDIKEEVCKKYPYIEKDIHLNIVSHFHSNTFQASNILVITVMNEHHEMESPYFTEALCTKINNSISKPQESYECFNPGKKYSFITMHTKEIQDYAYISENNIKSFCLKNDITFHIYRDVPDFLKEKNIFDAWCKPWLILQHIKEHETVSWIDSDILIGADYNIDLSKDIIIFNDPYFPMNSGFMTFKNNEKNISLLNNVIEQILNIDGKLDGVYNHGGDQPRFKNAFEKYYPEYSPESSLNGNTHPVYPKPISPHSHKYMLHFMGYNKHFRTAVMLSYHNIMTKKYGK